MKRSILVFGAMAFFLAVGQAPSQNPPRGIRWEAKADPIFYRTSTDLLAWSDPVRTGADGEGTSVWKADGGGYYLIACTGYSGRGEYYKLFFSETLAGFQDLGKIDMEAPAFAADAVGHGDVIRCGGEDRFYFQGTRDGGKTFRIGLATHKNALSLSRRTAENQSR